MRQHFILCIRVAVLVAFGLLAASCVVTSTPAPTGTFCTPGQARACVCPSGAATGTSVCLSDGTAYGACAGCSTLTCSRTASQSCTSSSECCPDNGTPTLCINYGVGVGQICAARCTTSAGCASGCCAALTDGTRACGPLSGCTTPPPTCSRTFGQTCGGDAECCPDAASGRRAVCTAYGSGATCWSTCNVNADCSSGCCAPRTDGVRTCGPTSACTTTACSRTFGQSCSVDGDCCPDAASGRRALCTNFSGSSTCWSSCTVNADCSSRCCTTRTDGMRSCAPASYCP